MSSQEFIASARARGTKLSSLAAIVAAAENLRARGVDVLDLGALVAVLCEPSHRRLDDEVALRLRRCVPRCSGFGDQVGSLRSVDPSARGGTTDCRSGTEEPRGSPRPVPAAIIECRDPARNTLT